jgi:anaerobic selenocysteine-containing dehydrogenase
VRCPQRKLRAGIEMHTRKTFCRFCHALCGIEVDVEGSRVIAVRGDRNHALSRGFTCEKGRQLPAQHHHPQRLRGSLRRDADGRFEPISSELAMDEIAQALAAIIERSGPRAVALYNGTKAWANVGYGLSRSWLDGIGSPSLYTTVTIDQPAKSMARALHGGWMAGHQDIASSDVALFVGSNPLQSFSSEHLRLPCGNVFAWLREYQQRGLQLVVIDPRRTELARRAALHLAVRPGEDPTLLAGMVRVILEHELYDREFVAEHAGGLAALRAAVEPYALEHVAKRCGVAARDVEAAARLFARGPRGSAVAGTGANMAPHPLATELLVSALNTLCGRYARAGERIAHAGVLAPAAPRRAQAIPPRPFWGKIPGPRVRGLRSFFYEQPSAALADEILTPGDGQVRALICNGGNPAVAFPDQRKVIRALESLELLVCLDVQPTPTAQLADYVIGCKLSLEKPDYTRHLEWYFHEPFAQFTPALIEPECDVIDEWEFFWGLAERMRVPLSLGRGVFGGPGPGRPVDRARKPTTEELMALEAADACIPLAEVRRHPSGAVFEAARCTVAPADPASAGRFELAPRELAEELRAIRAEPPAGGGFSHRLISRRMRQVFNSTGVQLDALRARGPGNPAFMSPGDMRSAGVAGGDLVEIESDHGRILAVAREDDGLPRGVISMAHSWGGLPGRGDVASEAAIGACTNALISSDRDFEPYSGHCRQSAIPVNVRPAAREA